MDLCDPGRQLSLHLSSDDLSPRLLRINLCFARKTFKQKQVQIVCCLAVHFWLQKLIKYDLQISQKPFHMTIKFT